MKITRYILFILPLTVNVALANSIPEWVNNVAVNCRDNELCSVGSGTSQSLANTDARENLSKYFETKVISRFSNKITSNGKNVQEQTSNDLVENSENILRGVIIRNTYRDGQYYYSFAVLDKGKASAGVKYDIEKIDARMEAIANGKIKSSEAATALMVSYNKREDLNRKYLFLTGESIAEVVSYRQVMDFVSVVMEEEKIKKKEDTKEELNKPVEEYEAVQTKGDYADKAVVDGSQPEEPKQGIFGIKNRFYVGVYADLFSITSSIDDFPEDVRFDNDENYSVAAGFSVGYRLLKTKHFFLELEFNMDLYSQTIFSDYYDFSGAASQEISVDKNYNYRVNVGFIYKKFELYGIFGYNNAEMSSYYSWKEDSGYEEFETSFNISRFLVGFGMSAVTSKHFRVSFEFMSFLGGSVNVAYDDDESFDNKITNYTCRLGMYIIF